MKILIYLYYFFRSTLLRGPATTIRLLKTEVNQEKKFNISSAQFIKSDSAEFFHYQGAAYLILFRVLKEIVPDTKNFHFVDIGSGKGRAIFVAEKYGYNSLTGLELNANLVEDAVKNAERYAYKRKESQLKFIHQNALDFEYINEPTVYFFFNPFNGNILKRVLHRIKESTTSETWFVYLNPLYAPVFDELKIEKYKVLKSGFYTEAIIYTLNKK